MMLSIFPSQQGVARRRALPLLLLLLVAAVSASAADPSRLASLRVDIRADGSARIDMDGDGPVPDTAQLVAALERLVGGSVDTVRGPMPAVLEDPFAEVEIPAEDELSGMVRHLQEREEWEYEGRTRDAFVRTGLEVRGTVGAGGWDDFAAATGANMLLVEVRHPDAAFVHEAPDGVAQRNGRHVNHIRMILPGEGIANQGTIRVHFGYGISDLAPMGAALLSLLALPFGLTLWLRRRALSATGADPAVVWFGYQRFLGWQVTAFTVAWVVAVLLLDVHRIVRLALHLQSPESIMGSSILLVLLPPLLPMIGIIALSRPVYTQIREVDWSGRDLIKQNVLTYLHAISPVFFLGMAVAGFLSDQIGRSFVWIGALLLTRAITAQLIAQAAQIDPREISFGPLRDRVFALAAQAGVKVEHLYYLYTGKQRLANAFAANGNNVLLSDYLLRHLNRNEVDAVVAHELAHLKHRHPVKMGRAGTAAIAVPLVAYLVATWIDLLPALTALLLLFAGAAVSSLLAQALSRRYERIADAEAVALTGEPAALVTGLAKIMRLNLLPMDWGRWDERLLTHPSTVRRAQMLGQTKLLLDEQADADSDEERYVLPPDICDEGPLFTTSHKSGVQMSNGWLLLLAVVAPPVLTGLAAEGLADGGAMYWLIWGAGLVVTVALYLAAINRRSVAGYAKLERRLRQRQRDAGLPDDGLFVGLSPHSVTRVYEGFADWDIGLLNWEGDRLTYAGEKARFTLDRARVVELRVGKGLASWLRTTRIFITWTRPDGSPRTFNLRPASSESLLAIRRDTALLFRDLDEWLQSARADASVIRKAVDAAPEEALPDFGPVTSTSVREATTLRGFLLTFGYMAGFAFGLSYLVGLSFHTTLVVLGAMALLCVFQVLPAWLSPRDDQLPPDEAAATEPEPAPPADPLSEPAAS